jgi:hypothetical protein
LVRRLALLKGRVLFVHGEREHCIRVPGDRDFEVPGTSVLGVVEPE